MGKPLSDSIFLDKLLDLILMFLGLYAAMALQDLVDHHKDRAQYVELLRGFKEELNSNPFLRGHSEEIRDSLRPHYSNVDTVSPAKVFAYTRWHKDSKLYRKKSEPFFLRD